MVIGVSTPDHTQAREMRMVGDRERIRAYAVTNGSPVDAFGSDREMVESVGRVFVAVPVPAEVRAMLAAHVDHAGYSREIGLG